MAARKFAAIFVFYSVALSHCLIGQGKRFDINLIKVFSDAMRIPVIASIGAGIAQHSSHVFEKKNASMPGARNFHKQEED
ncbi:imidazole glycerol phosphate synthase hisHF, chloroplastic [Lactuca sativa]|uniref:imidazole glycerol phosphate synthase hisHF, chloroplastic n=1 Tax=Lactuca sativa TaxID=4236 RepID=UPI000CD95F5E|nr:imidazole glycerol phosphate synthase hisHF, chloroplastic [Lactuca sativa]